MNRSWYKRAGVERVMGFCTDEEYEHFMQAVLAFEHMLIDADIRLLKYYLDISKDEQCRRLERRRTDPLRQWKASPIDAVALEHWDDYSKARDDMLQRTHNTTARWYVVRADDKRRARLNVIRHILSHMECPTIETGDADPGIVATYDQILHKTGFIAP